MTYRLLLIGLLASGCYAGYGPQQQTLPEPVQVAGPPGGGMDQGYYQNPNQPGDPQGYDQLDPNNQYQQDPNAQAPGEAQPDPQQEQQAMADVDDTEINATLDGQGTWEEDADYGRVWRPDATLVGADFTPYETCGSWVNTAYGPTFNCDYSWGWLPFHYGRWGFIGNGWGWVPGHHWGAAWVDWRHGGGYVGWRPMAPDGGHGRQYDSHWHFQNETAFGNGHIHGRELGNPGEGLRVTQPTYAPTLGGHRPTVNIGHVMATRHGLPSGAGGGGFRPSTAYRQPQYRQPSQSFRQPAYRHPTYQQPTYRQPAYRQPTYTQRPTYQRPTYSRPSYTQRPSSTFSPSRPSYSSPHYSAPTHSSSSSSHSSSSSSHSSGGGGHHR